MMSETHLVTIDDQLRLVLFGLECTLDTEFAIDTIERIFSDSKEDQVSEKRYTLWAGPRLTVTGLVEEYEPGDIWLTVETSKAFNPVLALVAERAKYQAYRLETQNDR